MISSRTLHLAPKRVLLAITDVCCVPVTFYLSAVLRFGWNEGAQFFSARVSDLLVACIVFPGVFYIVGLYEDRRLRNFGSIIAGSAVSVCVGALLCGLFSYATMSLEIRRGISLIHAATLFAAIVLMRMAHAEAVRRGFLGVRCLVIGTREHTQAVLRLVAEHPSAGLRIIGLVRSDVATIPLEEARTVACPTLGTLASLEKLVTEHAVSRLIVATAPDEERALLRQLRPFRYRGLALFDFVSLHESLAHEIPLDRIDDQWLLIAAGTNSMFHIRRLKRVVDIVGSLIILVPFVLVILPLAALAIKLTSGGPVLFRQERVGLSSRPFVLLKLRTMYADAETLTGPVWSSDNDPRITPVGRVLRKFRIDELPQLINVLRGEMSLVGPRPERPEFVRTLANSIPFYSERLLVRPGITGWAQVMAPYAASVEDSRCKLQYDLYYTKHMSLFLDTLVLVKTVKTMLFGRERIQGGRRAGQPAADKRHELTKSAAEGS